MTKKNIHDAHRQRMRAKLLKHGGDVFEPHELLELLLYFSITQKNTNPAAHALIDHQSCLQLLESDTEQRQQAEGVGPASAMLIAMISLSFSSGFDSAFPRRSPKRPRSQQS